MPGGRNAKMPDGVKAVQAERKQHSSFIASRPPGFGPLIEALAAPFT